MAFPLIWLATNVAGGLLSFAERVVTAPIRKREAQRKEEQVYWQDLASRLLHALAGGPCYVSELGVELDLMPPDVLWLSGLLSAKGLVTTVDDSESHFMGVGLDLQLDLTNAGRELVLAHLPHFKK